MSIPDALRNMPWLPDALAVGHALRPEAPWAFSQRFLKPDCVGPLPARLERRNQQCLAEYLENVFHNRVSLRGKD
jgi:hypothetical protein